MEVECGSYSTSCHVSQHLARYNVKTNVTRSGQVCSYQPRPPTSYTVLAITAVQWTRRLAEVSRVTGDDSGTRMAWLCRRQCIAMRASWVGQTDDRIYDVTIAGHQTSHSHTHTQCHPHGPLAYVSQSINQAIQTSNQTLVIVHRDHAPPTYRMP